MQLDVLDLVWHVHTFRFYVSGINRSTGTGIPARGSHEALVTGPEKMARVVRGQREAIL